MTDSAPPFVRSHTIGRSYDVAFDPVGAVVTTLGRNVVTWETSRKRRINSAHPLSHPSRVCYSTDGSLLVVKNTAGNSVVLAADTLEVVRALGGARFGEGPGPIVMGDGNLVEGSWNGDLLVRSLIDGAIVAREHQPEHMISSLAVSNDRSRIGYIDYDCDNGTSTVVVRRYPLVHRQSDFELSMGNVKHVALDGDRVAATLGGISDADVLTGQLNIWSISSGEVVAVTEPAPGSPMGPLALRPGTGDIVAVWERAVTAYDANASQLWSIPFQYPCAVAFSNDGTKLAIGDWEQGTVGTITP